MLQLWLSLDVIVFFIDNVVGDDRDMFVWFCSVKITASVTNTNGSGAKL